jgi:protein-S-isoprenylcysteine O-methyltransferase Ste14
VLFRSADRGFFDPHGGFSMLIAVAVLEFTLLFIFLLPKIFFTNPDGKFSVMWFITAGPFLGCMAVLGLAAGGVIHPTWVPGDVQLVLAAAGAILAACSCALIGFTLGTHRVPLARWHQENDAPKGIVTYGAYKYIRHPFYASFLICLTGATLAVPHPATLACLIYGIAILNHTASREERRLAGSTFGGDYAAYMARTGRFIPRPGRVDSVGPNAIP